MTRLSRLAVSHWELHVGQSALAVPVLNSEREAVAAIEILVDDPVFAPTSSGPPSKLLAAVSSAADVREGGDFATQPQRVPATQPHHLKSRRSTGRVEGVVGEVAVQPLGVAVGAVR